jgi:hypothetical protein
LKDEKQWILFVALGNAATVSGTNGNFHGSVNHPFPLNII